jgi:hypothetical protein
MKILFTCVTKQATLARSSTVLSLPLQKWFLGFIYLCNGILTPVVLPPKIKFKIASDRKI